MEDQEKTLEQLDAEEEVNELSTQTQSMVLVDTDETLGQSLVLEEQEIDPEEVEVLVHEVGVKDSSETDEEVEVLTHEVGVKDSSEIDEEVEVLTQSLLLEQETEVVTESVEPPAKEETTEKCTGEFRYDSQAIDVVHERIPVGDSASLHNVEEKVPEKPTITIPRRIS